jgi:medium-chain acyl-[acyl-carrier-protein] hydrolase
LRLFAFPYAGGSAAVYHAWRRLLPAEVHLCPVELRGRGTRISEAPLQNLDLLTASLADELAPFLEVPFAFFGHSMGALVAYELTRLLRNRGEALPRIVMVSGRPAPHCTPERRNLHLLSENDLKEELGRLDGTLAEILEHPELMDLFLPILRADFAVCERYRHSEESPLACPISAFGGLNDPDVSQKDVQAWHSHTRGPFRARMFPGNHFFLNGEAREPLVRAVGEDLVRLLVE